jgi:hypothetical protein
MGEHLVFVLEPVLCKYLYIRMSFALRSTGTPVTVHHLFLLAHTVHGTVSSGIVNYSHTYE